MNLCTNTLFHRWLPPAAIEVFSALTVCAIKPVAATIRCPSLERANSINLPAQAFCEFDAGLGNDINLKLSKERAQLVAEQFRRRGLTPAVVTGFGNTIPVASTLTEEGKEKNRRVELWLKK